LRQFVKPAAKNPDAEITSSTVGTSEVHGTALSVSLIAASVDPMPVLQSELINNPAPASAATVNVGLATMGEDEARRLDAGGEAVIVSVAVMS